MKMHSSSSSILYFVGKSLKLKPVSFCWASLTVSDLYVRFMKYNEHRNNQWWTLEYIQEF